jgi:hypothetical protein
MRFAVASVGILLSLGPLYAEMPLNIIVVEGEGAINNIRQRTARETIVQVEDENHKPVAGAVVTFTLPSQGAGGAFANGAQTLTVMTNAEGRAAATGLRVNKIAGNWSIRVNASFGERSGTVSISQTNAVAAAAGAGAATGTVLSTKLIIILAVVAGAAAAGGAIAATRSSGSGSNSNSSAAPTTITLGGSTVGSPH